MDFRTYWYFICLHYTKIDVCQQILLIHCWFRNPANHMVNSKYPIILSQGFQKHRTKTVVGLGFLKHQQIACNQPGFSMKLCPTLSRNLGRMTNRQKTNGKNKRFSWHGAKNARAKTRKPQPGGLKWYVHTNWGRIIWRSFVFVFLTFYKIQNVKMMKPAK